MSLFDINANMAGAQQVQSAQQASEYVSKYIADKVVVKQFNATTRITVGDIKYGDTKSVCIICEDCFIVSDVTGDRIINLSDLDKIEIFVTHDKFCVCNYRAEDYSIAIQEVLGEELNAQQIYDMIDNLIESQ